MHGGSGTEDLAVEAKELAELVLIRVFDGPLPPNCRTKGGRFGKQRQTSWFEKSVEINQKSDTDEKDAIIFGSPLPMNSHFPCPFYIRQKEKYRSCSTWTDPLDMRGLKRHLETKHCQPLYCPTCHTTFISSRDWEEHIRRHSCTPSDKPRPEGISILQIQQLAQQESSQWLSIWEIVFPGVEPPSLAFPSNGAETTVRVLRDFWLAEGDQIVSNFLAKKRLRGGERSPVTLGPLVLGLVIDRLVGGHTWDESDD
ncbi:hypothetical protein NUW58_g2073 [Xylaria curta]|uniref:Uncharacterized protein n=1 Tax=Xylaria curta TaxID=42375 RepID=A0ACC1PIN2_9PEZI|nr:hypothetical protein NUW58_g2073 [Xylaria curta]